MHPHFQKILEEVQSNQNLTEEQRNVLVNSIEEAEKLHSITEFKLERTEKVKKTTAVLLEETITELEKKNKEAQVEATLERIRSKTNAMQESSQLSEVTRVVFQEALRLGIGAKACDLVVLDKETGHSEFWISGDIDSEDVIDFKLPELKIKHHSEDVIHFKLPKLRNKHYLDALEAWKKGKKLRSTSLKGRSCQAYMRQMTDNMYDSNMPPKVASFLKGLPAVVHTEAYMRYGYFRVAGVNPLSQEEQEILKRFAKVFEQTYTRFLDLQKAEAQAREARIEVALERVRAKTMAMHKSHELKEIVSVMYNEMEQLGLAKWGCNIMIFHEESTQIEFWLAEETDTNHTGNYFAKGKEHLVYRKLWNHWKKQGPPLTLHHQDAYKREFDEYWLGKTDFKHLPDVVKKSVFDRNEVFLNYATMRYGMLNAISYVPINNEMLEILARFAKVFEQAYTRFLDLQKAEAQAREAQIEAALEKVRSRSLAMHNSDELSEVAVLLYEELKNLGLTQFFNCGYVEVNEQENVQYVYTSTFDGRWAEVHQIPLTGDKIFDERYDAWKNQVQVFHQIVSGNKLKKHIEYSTRSPAVAKMTSRFPDPAVFYCCNFSKGYLHLITEARLTMEVESVLGRFTNVFEQTYTRFLDLKKAEAQAREAQIEAALERVRARSMAMHNSNELKEVAALMYEQMEPLALAKHGCEIILCDEENDQLQFWSTNLMQAHLPEPYNISRFSHPIFRKQWKAWKQKQERLVITNEGKVKRDFDNFIFTKTDFRKFPDHVKKFIRSGKKDVFTLAIMKFGLLEAVDDAPLSEEKFQVLGRFAKVFEQSYTRFLDLKKAEAQAWEAQIEAALERVRSAAMAMHESDQLSDTIGVLFEQLSQLGVKTVNAYLVLYNLEKDEFEFRMTGKGGDRLPVTMTFSFEEMPIFRSAQKTWKSGELVIETEYLEGARKEWLDLIRPINKLLPSKARLYVRDFPNGIFTTSGRHAYGSLGIMNHHPASEGAKRLLGRFAREFEIVYKRFLDLQKAEAQAREALIEAALERVRTQTMAMHTSQDVGNTMAIIFSELVNLGINAERNGILIMKEDENAELWTARPDSKGKVELLFWRIDMSFHQMARDAYAGWQNQELSTEYLLKGDDLKAYYEGLNNSPDYPGQFDLDKLPEYEHCSLFHFPEGTLYLFTPDPVVEDDKQILIRFTSIFGQTYRRYLDLQKAEAQAREAEIEAAMERVRSRSMAMHKSEELQDVIDRLLLEIESLGVQMGSSYLVTEVDENIRKGVHIWLQNNVNLYAEKVHLVYLDHPLFHNFYKAWWDKTPFYTEIFNKKEKNRLFNHLFKHSPQLSAIPDDRKKYVLDGSGFSRSVVIFKNVAFIIQKYDDIPFTPEQISIQKRFGSVFEQAYTRFLDLQKAEAQAREAQIEAALERIRAKAMAMHTTKDLTDTINVFYQQIGFLSETPRRCGIDLIDKETQAVKISSMNTSEQGQSVEAAGQMILKGHPVLEGIYKHWVRQEEYFPVLKGKELKEYYEFVKPYVGYPDYQTDVAHYGHFFSFSEGCIYVWTTNIMPEEELKIYRRFTSVLSLTYNRFNDLQKAEAQAREAQIEAALERIRAKAMAMHNSEDVGDATTILFEELQKLGIETIRCGVGIYKDQDMEIWSAVASKKGEMTLVMGQINMKIHHVLMGAYHSWKAGDVRYSYKLKGKDLQSYYRAIYNQPDYRLPHQDISKIEQSFQCTWYPEGGLYAMTKDPLTEKSFEIFDRFGKVFQLTYRRYLDLKEAEAKAKEAQIEVALEKVRSRTMGMQSSEELPEVANLLFFEIQSLGIPAWSCGYNILATDKNSATCWMSSEGALQKPFTLRLFGEASFDEMGKFINSRKTTLVQKLGGKALEEHYNYMKSFPDLLPTFMDLEEKGLSLPTYQINHLCKFSHGFLLFITYEHVPESHDLFKRFTNVFEQTYTRFLDLKKAEEQAREAQIEVALERVRARASAMHKADELKEVAMELRTQMALLGQKELEVCGIHLYEVDEEYFESWGAMRPEGSSQIIQGQSRFPKKGVTIIEEMLKYYISGKRDYVLVNEGEKAAEFFNMMKEHAPDVFKHFVALLNKIPSQERIAYWSLADFKGGSILMVTYNPPEEDSRNLLRRVANVFDLAYRRFLDLRKAEAQAREAQIETALERIRARALAMHDSSELDEVVSEMRKQMALLGQAQLETIAIHLYPEEGDEFESWYAIRSPHKKKGKVLTGTTRFSKKDTAVARKMLSLYHSNKSEYKMELQGKILDEWQEMAIDHIPGMEKEWGDNIPIYQYWYFADFSGGSFVLIPREEPNEEAKELLKRSSSVFDLAYRRYLDLLSTEEREKEAIKQASLDRVRAEIASMRTTKDLERITPLVWEELTALGVPFFRCGIFIIREEEQMVHAYLSTPSGESLAALHIGFGDTEIGMIQPSIDNWRKQERYTEEWDQNRFIQNTQIFMERGHIESKKKYQAGETPPEKLVLQLVPFTQGMLYVGSSENLTNEQIELVQSLAESFSVAYARYEDFQQLEKAKERVEDTLTELKSTQDQLIHSEKMASLGELTAGIAHEIQNPLNFVNNFSDINKELAEELIEEIQNGNAEEAEAIIADIIGNEEKIHHHGKRAEEIVRSMLLHSRGSSGEKESTDINLLADEYMRLSFHGMRAKDKSFNADFKLDLEEGLPKLRVVQQDIGRVLLNLVNNAFYATNEKSKSRDNGKDYQPAVTLSTRKLKDSIEIHLKDNGSGIPKNVLDKIFQPFYTTKPTGEGTGLGLSLSFDIITKGHGGTIDVKSKVGKGTEFIITLPVTTQ